MSDNLYFAGRLIKSNGQWVVTDRLGSVVKSGTETLRYFPWGEERTVTAHNRDKFATYHRDASGLDYALNRYYSSSHGRFLTPDPYVASAAPTNPQSWNRYPYVENDPVNFADPWGLDQCSAEYGTPCFSVTGTAEGDWVKKYLSLIELTLSSFTSWPSLDLIPDPGPASPGERVEPEWADLSGLQDAKKLALRLLEKPSCAGLYGGGPESANPAQLLSGLVAGNTGQGSVRWGDLGGAVGGAVTAAVTTGILGRNDQNQSIFTGVTITINDNLSAPWFAGYPDTFGLGTPDSSYTQNVYRAVTLLHELGHAFALIAGAGGSRLVTLSEDPGTSRDNTKLVYEKCFGP
jgi:RHS repeat-associated protein